MLCLVKFYLIIKDNFIMALNIMIKLVVLTQNIYLELDDHKKSRKGMGSFTLRHYTTD